MKFRPAPSYIPQADTISYFREKRMGTGTAWMMTWKRKLARTHLPSNRSHAPGRLTRRQAVGALVSSAMLDAENRTQRIVDSHVHVWKRDPHYPWAKETTRPPEKDAPPEMLLELMRENGVERTVRIHVIYYRWDNSYAADVLRQYPQ